VFAQARSRWTAFAYIGALLAERGDRKSCWQLAEAAGHATPRRMQALLAEHAWDWAATVLAAFRDLAFAEPDLVGLAERMDARISQDMEIEEFVTVILTEFSAGEVRLVNCGHHPPVKVAVDSAELQLVAPDRPEPPLGLHPCPARQDITLKPGSGCCSIPTAWSRRAIARAGSLSWAARWPRR
jgi:hypothetical protein